MHRLHNRTGAGQTATHSTVDAILPRLCAVSCAPSVPLQEGDLAVHAALAALPCECVQHMSYIKQVTVCVSSYMNVLVLPCPLLHRRRVTLLCNCTTSGPALVTSSGTV